MDALHSDFGHACSKADAELDATFFWPRYASIEWLDKHSVVCLCQRVVLNAIKL